MKFSIIIVTYNSEKFIGACLESIFRETKEPDFEIIVIDNDSRDQTIPIIKKFPRVLLIENKQNIGFAKANNLGLKKATGDYVLFLNPDTEVKNQAIDRLVRRLEQNPNVAMATGALFYPDGLRQPNIKRHPTIASQLLIALKLTRLPWPLATLQKYLAKDFNYTAASEVEQIMGACMLGRRQQLKSVGGFDEDYFIWFEDIELCLTYDKRGWPIIYYPEAVFIHHESTSFKTNSPLLNQRRFLKSLRTFAKKHWFPTGYFLILLATPLAIMITAIGLMLGARPKTQSEL